MWALGRSLRRIVHVGRHPTSSRTRLPAQYLRSVSITSKKDTSASTQWQTSSRGKSFITFIDQRLTSPRAIRTGVGGINSRHGWSAECQQPPNKEAAIINTVTV